MDITIWEDKGIEIDMRKQIKETIALFKSINEQVPNGYTSPANLRLFEVSNNEQEFDKKETKVFHSVVAKCLYLMKRARPDIELVISFLCTRVRDSTYEDWKKLK